MQLNPRATTRVRTELARVAPRAADGERVARLARAETFTVALVGADGAGKTTLGRRLERDSSLPIKYLYMGLNPEASNHSLPTTRLLRALQHKLGQDVDRGGPPDPDRDRARKAPKGALKRLLSGAKSMLSLGQRLSEEWYRQAIAWSYQRKGYVVVFDRHFFSDYYAHDIAAAQGTVPLGRRFHGFVLKHFYPKPDLVVLLDAPAAVLFERKGEGTLELLERRRREYLDLGDELDHFAIVDAGRPADEVARRFTDILEDFRSAHSGARVRGRA